MTKINTPLSNEVIEPSFAKDGTKEIISWDVMTAQCRSTRVIPKFNPNRTKVTVALKAALGDKLAPDLQCPI